MFLVSLCGTITRKIIAQAVQCFFLDNSKSIADIGISFVEFISFMKRTYMPASGEGGYAKHMLCVEENSKLYLYILGILT